VLGRSGIQHRCPQQLERELAAALRAQEQAIIGSARIVDVTEINDAGFDRPAEFE
jgi:hypothetical protein